MEIFIHKADSFNDKELKESIININKKIPDCTGKEVEEIFLNDADKIYNALSALPQGTINKLIALVLKKVGKVYAER